jgi:myo-inositol-1-phosphate synthase
VDVSQIRVAVAGVGNCASSLVQGVLHHRDGGGVVDRCGMMHELIGGYRIGDVGFVAGFDVDARKVGMDLSEAIFSEPNCTSRYVESIPSLGVVVARGILEDGVDGALAEIVPVARQAPEVETEDVASILRQSAAHVLVCYLPTGARRATQAYAGAALAAGVAFVNCNPEPVAADATWRERFRAAGLPLLGDDVKSQIGATSLHRALAGWCEERGVVIDSCYQLNIGGNTDFLNMRDVGRAASKRMTKTISLSGVVPPGAKLTAGPSDFVPHLEDRKIAYIHIEGRGFLGMPFSMEVRLGVEDSPNSAGVVVDAVRIAKVATERGLAGPLDDVSTYLFKNPGRPVSDRVAREALDRFIRP